MIDCSPTCRMYMHVKHTQYLISCIGGKMLYRSCTEMLINLKTKGHFSARKLPRGEMFSLNSRIS